MIPKSALAGRALLVVRSESYLHLFLLSSFLFLCFPCLSEPSVFPPLMDLQPQINALIEQTTSLECSENDANPTNFIECEHTIIARIYTGKAINMNAFKSTILKAWNPKGKVNTNLQQTNTMAFIFESDNDVTKTLNQSWSFRDSQIITQRWPPDKALHEIDLDKANFCLQAFNIPVCYTNQSTATFIGNQVGTFLKTDLNSASQKWEKALRIQVELNLHKPLTRSISIPCQGRPNFLIELRYERLSEFCFKCGLLGHKFQFCNAIQEKEDMVPSTLPYGPWVKAENTHIPNPDFTQTSIQKSPSNPNLNLWKNPNPNSPKLARD